MTTKLSKLSLSNLKHSVISQFIIIIFGVIRALIIPVLLGVTEFGYWQIYLLYAGFVGVFSFGFNDGIYLRYGGKQKDELPWELLRGSFVFYFLALFSISLLFVIALSYINLSPDKAISFSYVIVNIGLMGFSSLFLFLFQTTNQIKKYSIYMLVDKFFFVLILLSVYLYSDVSFKYLMIIDCFSKFLLIIVMSIDCRKDLFGKISTVLLSLQEFYKNIGVGIKLMLANLASMLVMNMSRFFVEQYYTLEEFSAFSFGITLTNLVLMAMNGIVVVIYPALRRIPAEKYHMIYSELTDVVTIFLFFSLFAYYPIYYFVFNVMPDYKEVLSYFNILFVLSLLQIKMNLVVNTFYKVLREEKALLKANIVCVILGFSLSTGVVLFHETIELMALALLVNITYRVYRSDYFIQKIFKRHDHNTTLLELGVFSVFLIITTFLSNQASFSITLLFSVFFLFNKRSKIKYWLTMLKGN
jgi:O-antigen/teichoic acid export membrane protein